MERVLTCQELLGIILDDVCIDKRTLAQCIRVRSCWFDAAARRLWHTLPDVEILFRLLPMVVRGGNRVLAYQTCSVTGWTRFHLYARYVKVLHPYTRKSNPEVVREALSQLLIAGSSKCLLPNLEELAISSRMVLLETLFFAPKGLRKLNVAYVSSSSEIYNVFNCILPQISDITSLSIYFNTKSNISLFDEDIGFAFKHLSFLEDVTINGCKITPGIILGLAALPNLKTMKYYAGIWEEEFKENIQASRTKIDSPFRCLKELCFCSPMALFEMFLSMRIRLPLIEKVHIDIGKGATELAITKCSERIAMDWNNLSSIYFLIFEQGTPLHFSMYLPLSAIQHLQTIVLGSSLPLVVRNEDIDVFTRSSPQLRVFIMWSCQLHYVPLVTLSSLISFAKHCKHIRTLDFNVNAKFLNPLPSDVPVMKNLKNIDFKLSPITDPDAVALYLYRLCTPACNISYGFTNEEYERQEEYWKGWARVEKSLDLIFKVTSKET